MFQTNFLGLGGKWSFPAALSIPHSRTLHLIIITSFFATANATNHITRCCLKAAREPSIRIDLNANPWNVCSYNETDKYPEGMTFPSVNHTMGWCRSHCPGFKHSDLSQWLEPLATWVAPYVGLLLLCPIGAASRKKGAGDNPANDSDNRRTNWKSLVDLWTNTQEYINILGDPASAISGAFSEIASDVEMIWKLQSLQKPACPEGDRTHRRVWKIRMKPPSEPRKVTCFSRLVLWIAILEGDTPFKEMDDVELAKNSTPTKDLLRAINTLIVARADFVKGVFLPVILTIAVTASVFYDAYTKLGDYDTAHNLAFGIWYSWLLILSVAGNSFASSIDPGMARIALQPYLALSDNRVPLRDRYVNAHLWDQWLRKKLLWDKPDTIIETLRSTTATTGEQAGQDVNAANSGTPLKSPSENLSPINHANTEVQIDESPVQMNGWTWWKFLGWQFTGWVCVAFPTASAAAISYTTPTVGLGCRSFNFLLYGIIAIVVAVVHVFRKWVADRLSASNLPNLLNWLYRFLVSVNALVIIIGTVFHLSGLYTSCRCKRLFAPDSDIVELNRNTHQAVDNAKAFWLSVGYVAFGFAWIVCALVVAVRKYITIHMAKEDEGSGELGEGSGAGEGRSGRTASRGSRRRR